MLNERVFREYVARALYLETLDAQKVRQGKTTLNMPPSIGESGDRAGLMNLLFR